MLKLTAALAIINRRQYHLQELLDKLHQPETAEDFLLSAVANDAACDNLWKEIAKIYLPSEMDRLDIICWRDHFKNLHNQSVYIFFGSPLNNGIILGQPVMAYTGSEYVNSNDLLQKYGPLEDNVHAYSLFRVKGQEPAPGTLGYYLQYSFGGGDVEKSQFILCHDKIQIPTIYDRGLAYLAEDVWKRCELKFLQGITRIKLFRTIFERLPTIHEIKAIIDSLLSVIGVHSLDFNSSEGCYYRTKILRGTDPDEGDEYFSLSFIFVQLKF